MATKTLVTAEDFLSLLDAREDERLELVKGEIFAGSLTAPLHNLVRDRLLILLGTFLKGRALGTAIAEQAFVLSEHTVRIPDVALVREGGLHDLHRAPEGAPELAIEVISPSNTPREMDQKISDYFAAGSKRVWVVYPEEREVYMYGFTGLVRRSRDEAIEEPELLPGFSIKVSDLFV